MAIRPVFTVNNNPPHYNEVNVEFKYSTGFAISQKRKSVNSLHEAFLQYHPDYKVLEVSTSSELQLGMLLSAFNLRRTIDGKSYSVEALFQASKVFENGGPYEDLLNRPNYEIKKDTRLKDSGYLTGFRCFGEEFPLEPKTFFYDWLYINALKENPRISNQLMEFNAFTDIAFNPTKSINCQARTCAIFVSLNKAGVLEEALKNKDNFVSIVYGGAPVKYEQESLF